MNDKNLINFLFLLCPMSVAAQTVAWHCSTEKTVWKTQKVSLVGKSSVAPRLTARAADAKGTFRTWGTCFNELGWDALQLLSADEQSDILRRLFSPSGDLRFGMGRIPMNANDYARDWYSCDEVSGDFDLRYFNIERDKQALIPFIKAAQRQNSAMTFWASPWSPPTWMKVNQDYPVRSDAKYNKMDARKDVILYYIGDSVKNSRVFPQQLSATDYFIQEPRYLQTYANYFCRFIEAYAAEGIGIGRVMFQNESWSYTPYPGCAWTPEGIIRFNAEYLSPTLKKRHPQVQLFLGTINTNRYEVIDQVLADPRAASIFQGVGFQWEGGQILPRLKQKYPQYAYVQTESECGWGSFDWKAAEHTFSLIAHYLGNGCEDYTFWNAILADDGVSGWGWKQNALIRVNSQMRKATFTPEYYAVKHYTQAVTPGSKLLAASENKELNIVIFLSPENKFVVLADNVSDAPQSISVQLGAKFLNVSLPAHSLNSFVAISKI